MEIQVYRRSLYTDRDTYRYERLTYLDYTGPTVPIPRINDLLFSDKVVAVEWDGRWSEPLVSITVE